MNSHESEMKRPSLEELFAQVNLFGGASLFSTGMDGKGSGRELTGINPVIVLTENHLIIGKEIRYVKSALEELDSLVESINNLPDEVGLLGYVSYDYKNRIEEKGLYSSERQKIYKDFYFAVYEYYFLTSRDKDTGRIIRIDFDFPFDRVIPFSRKLPPRKKGISRIVGTSQNRKTFTDNVEKIRKHIKEGDIYQANLTRTVYGKSTEHPLDLALALVESNRIEYGVFACYPEGYIISTSPELFFKIEDDIITASPIKGTAPRSKEPEEDNQNREKLINSGKDLAELAMIVDLLRNDLSRISSPGSVQVSPFPLLMQLDNVYHLYADITGRISHNTSLADIIKALFPGGSITGCPKIRSCQILEDIEGEPRGIYTGSFGFINGKGDATFNIMIRTLFLQNSDFFYQVGGGITLLSDGNEEFDETRDKGASLCRALDMEETDCIF